MNAKVNQLRLQFCVASCETEVVLTEAFWLYESLLPDKSFYDCGLAGPRLIMTDDADAELTLECIRQNVKEKQQFVFPWPRTICT